MPEQRNLIYQRISDNTLLNSSSSSSRHFSNEASMSTSSSQSRRGTASINDSSAHLTAEALERLQISGGGWQANPNHSGDTLAIRFRGRASLTPSATSVSTGLEDDDDEGGRPSSRQTEIYMKDYLLDHDHDYGSENDRERKGKGKAKAKQNATISDLPAEVLISIFSHLTTEEDALSCIKVCKQWCDLAYPIIWQRPSISRLANLASFARVLLAPTTTQPYAEAVRRINLSHVLEEKYGDEIFMALKKCTKTERMTPGPKSDPSSKAMSEVFRHMPNLCAVDLSHMRQVDDSVVKALAETCSGLQGLNVTMCRLVGDEAISLLADKCKNLRRLKVNGCIRLTDKSLVAIARECPQLLEVDIADLAQCTSATVHAILLNSTQLRDLKVTRNQFITSDGFPNLPALLDMDDRDSEIAASHAQPFATNHDHRLQPDKSIPLRMLMPRGDQLAQLRVVDLTDCPNFTDTGLINLIASAPRIRALTLAKCVKLTDLGLKHIAALGRNLHHLHIAHCSEVTDLAVIEIARACGRLRYVDFACCPLLTDMSVSELATNIPKLKRVGLVKVVNITDEAIHSLVERAATLERLHLSYCNNLTIPAVTYLLNKLPRLTHLSLTGVAAFRHPALQAYCRPAPKVFNAHQAASFCVFSGNGIGKLRRHLNACAATSDDGSTRRDSASSNESVNTPARFRGTRTTIGQDPSISSAMAPAFASHGPNFLAPSPHIHSSSSNATSRSQLQGRDVERPRTAGPNLQTPTNVHAGPSTGEDVGRRRTQTDGHGSGWMARPNSISSIAASPSHSPIASLNDMDRPDISESDFERMVEVPEERETYVARIMRAAGLRRQRESHSASSPGREGGSPSRSGR